MRTDKTVLCSEYDGLGLSVLSVEPEGVCKGVVQISHGMAEDVYKRQAKDIETLKETGRFVKISAASLKESHPHDIHITKEAPNYSIDE